MDEKVCFLHMKICYWDFSTLEVMFQAHFIQALHNYSDGVYLNIIQMCDVEVSNEFTGT